MLVYSKDPMRCYVIFHQHRLYVFDGKDQHELTK